MADKHNKSERHAIINKHAAALCKMAGEDVDVLYEMMERLAQGNPRFTKKERGQFNRCITTLIQAISVYARQIADMNTIWNQLNIEVAQLERVIELMKEIEKNMMTCIRDRNWDGLIEFERRYRDK